MKKIIILIGSLVLGVCSGAIGVLFVIAFIKDIPLSLFWQKLASINGFDLLGSALLSVSLTFIAILLQLVLHEVGHLVCGLATGYRFVSFRIFNLTFIQQNKKFRIKRFSIAGTSGQCLLTPPDKPLQEISTMWYNLGGVAVNLLTAIVALISVFLADKMPHSLELFLILFGTIGLLFGLTNGIPLKLSGIGNDGHNMYLLQKNKKSKQALVMQLRFNALIQEGIRPKEMPKEWFEPTEVDYSDTLQTTIQLIRIAHLQDEEKWDVTFESLEEAMRHKNEIIGLFVKEIACELIFCAWVLGKNERATELYTTELSTYVQQCKHVTSSKQRFLCALALYQEKDRDKAEKIYNIVCQKKEQYLMQGEAAMDIALMKSILNSDQTKKESSLLT